MQRIFLSGKNGSLVDNWALVDDEDFDLVSGYSWNCYTGGRSLYARTGTHLNNHYAKLSLHTLLTGFLMVDHLNHNGLDNQRFNLREINKSRNAMNQQKKLSSSRFKGVTRRASKWAAQIKVAGVKIYLGVFELEEEAALAYDNAAREHFGAYACVNFPRLGEQSSR